MQTVIEGKELPKEEGSSGKIKVTYEGSGQIKNGKLIISNPKVSSIDFIKPQIQP